MIDPKVVEMQTYNELPHLVTPVVTDPKKVLLALRWVVDEMEQRYQIFAKTGVRNIGAFNDRPLPKSRPSSMPRPPPREKRKRPRRTRNRHRGYAAEPEAPERRRGGGNQAHLRPARQRSHHSRPDALHRRDHRRAGRPHADRPGGCGKRHRPHHPDGARGRHSSHRGHPDAPRDVVTGIIKANIPSRIAFQVASGLDSRVILDQKGAEKLLGQGDMLYLPPASSQLQRSQGVLVTDDEIHRLVKFVAEQAKPKFESSIHDKLNSPTIDEEDVTDEDEELVDKVLEVMKQERRASTSLFQRRLRLGYTRAARIVDILEQRGIVGPRDGAKDREILIDLDSID